MFRHFGRHLEPRQSRIRAPRAAVPTSRCSGHRRPDSCGWVPCSITRPSDITRIWSASTTVDRRWAITRVVCSAATSASVSWIACSVRLSSDEVASSKIRICGFLRIARAMATRCFSPPDSFSPRSPTTVSHPSGNPSTKSSDVRHRSRLTRPRPASHRPAVGDVVIDAVVNSTVSCGTMPIAARRLSCDVPRGYPDHRS
jgi:hypothetical protein